jgi:hypothetical protein
MKKTILAVILLAAAGGAYYFLQMKKSSSESNIQQKHIIGKWKLDSLNSESDSINLVIALIGTLNSNFLNYEYDFRKDGYVLKFLQDRMQKDTVRYEWTKDNLLLWKEPGDSAGQNLTVVKLNKDSLLLQTKDSTVFYFKKLK